MPILNSEYYVEEAVKASKAESDKEIAELKEQLTKKNEYAQMCNQEYVNMSQWYDTVVERNNELQAHINQLCEASQAVVARWDSPKWKEQEHTGVFIDKLRQALEECK